MFCTGLLRVFFANRQLPLSRGVTPDEKAKRRIWKVRSEPLVTQPAPRNRYTETGLDNNSRTVTYNVDAGNIPLASHGLEWVS